MKKDHRDHRSTSVSDVYVSTGVLNISCKETIIGAFRSTKAARLKDDTHHNQYISHFNTPFAILFIAVLALNSLIVIGVCVGRWQRAVGCGGRGRWGGGGIKMAGGMEENGKRYLQRGIQYVYRFDIWF